MSLLSGTVALGGPARGMRWTSVSKGQVESLSGSEVQGLGVSQACLHTSPGGCARRLFPVGLVPRLSGALSQRRFGLVPLAPGRGALLRSDPALVAARSLTIELMLVAAVRSRKRFVHVRNLTPC